MLFRSKRYAVEPYQLRRWNSLPSDVLHVGQKLRVRADGTVSRYTVRRGDTLSEIARRFAVPQRTLRQLNGLRSDRLAVGQKLRLEADAPPPAAPIVSTGPPAPTRTYTVRRGDNLTEIARLHQMSVSQLRKFNNLRRSVIHPGDRLKVKPLLGGAAGRRLDQGDWHSLFAGPQGVRSFTRGDGPYFYRAPRAAYQKNTTYYENEIGRAHV